MSPESKVSEVVGTCAPASRTGIVTRWFDLVCALGGLIFCAPAFGIIALAIKLDDGGAVFFRQCRIGKSFRPFRLYKFRTMVEDSTTLGALTAPEDPRITRSGRMLRRYKFDELPQLWNVLIGDMRLVGARPEVERYVRMFPREYAILLQDRPGITDPASLAFRREDQILCADRLEEQYVNEILPAKLTLSLEYQQRRTFVSDLSILLQTLIRIAR